MSREPFDPPTAQPLVLIAVPGVSIRAHGSAALRRAGFRVVEANSGREVLRACAELEPDLILADLMLNGSDAIRLITSVRRIAACRTTPVFVLSDLLHSELIHRVFALGRTDFVSLPIQWMVLTHRIRQAIALRRHLDQLEASSHGLEEAQRIAASASEEAMMLRHYDRLTGLPNRSMFLDSLGLAMNQNERKGRMLAILLLDIDRFKAINESIGRAGGDQMLLAIARRLQRSIRPGDLLSRDDDDDSRVSLARMGGNEFAIFVGELKEPDAATRIAGRLLAAFQPPFHWEDHEHFLSASIGIAIEDDSAANEETLFERAERALRSAKERTGPSFSIWDKTMCGHGPERLEVKNDFMRAIDRGQLFLRYQPIIDSRTGALLGAEGLLRWVHPERGPVSPVDFIPIAEENGLATQLGEWVLREGFRQAKKWHDDGTPLKISLNVSTEQLVQGTIVGSVRAALCESGLSPALVQLELSERGALRDDRRILQQLHELSEMGLTLAVDDFGIGQTALSYLATLPVRVIKIDRFFIERVLVDEASASITGAIVAMARRLGLEVVAEGVETQEQARFLRDAGCDAIQGFFYSKPLPARDLERLLHERSTSDAALDLDDGNEFGDRQITTLPSVVEIGSSPPAPLRLPRGAELTEDVSEHKQREKRMMRLAHRDFLTDLLNRYAFEERLELALAQGSRFDQNVAVILLDLDLFKQVNDTHGHHVGDQLLVTVAERLRRCVRQVDALARVGGDEFAIVHAGFEDIDGLAKLAERVIEELTAPIDVDGRRLLVSTSIGIAVDSGGRVAAQEIVQQADRALYKAKADGKNCFRFHAAEMDHRMLRAAAIGDEMRGAEARGELFLAYQPQFDLRTGTLAGVEALLRWRSPLRGLIDTTEFIAIAESTGQIVPIGEWTLRTACADARHLCARAGRTLSMAVNLSAVQFSGPELASAVMRILGDSGVDPACLELEISERLLHRATPHVIDSLESLHARGVRLTLDNFGRGSASLEHFKRLPFDKVKIDRRWISPASDAEPQSDWTDMANAVVRLAKRLDLTVVASGIEHPDQAEGLAAEGCDLGQGYHFGRPARLPEIERLLLVWSSRGEAGGQPASDDLANIH